MDRKKLNDCNAIRKTPTRKIPTRQTPHWKIPTQKIPTWNIPTHVFKHSHSSFQIFCFLLLSPSSLILLKLFSNSLF